MGVTMHHADVLRAFVFMTVLSGACGGSHPPAPQEQPRLTQSENVTLTSQHWSLAEATDPHGSIAALFVAGRAPLELTFAEGRISIANACNVIHGTYEQHDQTLTMGHFVSTQMACADLAVDALDPAATENFSGTLYVAQLTSSGGSARLVLEKATGERYVFIGRATVQTRFGSEGELVFFEVGPHTATCNDGNVERPCLQVRELHYDEQGIRQGQAGAFENFYGRIEGFEHQRGQRSVLRVRRFVIPNPPQDASSQAYVLDMVVESEIVQ